MTTAHIVIINEEGLVLGVSRKDDHTNFGLPGGKMETEDQNNPIATAFRETREETGLDAMGLELIFATHMNGKMGHTYLAKSYHGEINTDEPHAVEWVPFERLINGGFGKYNQLVYNSLKDMGVKFQLDIDIEPLKDELNIFMKDNKFSDFHVSVSVLRKITDFFVGDTYYYLALNGAPYGMCSIDEDFDNGIKEIAKKYGVRLIIDSEYYSK